MKSTRSQRAASGRFVLRINPGLHASLRRAARELGLSLNDYCARRLATTGSPLLLPPFEETVSRASVAFGESLIGVAVFGSWARGEAADRSDLDLLIVLDRSVSLDRALYRRWDGDGSRSDTHPIEPHFVHLPGPDETVAGIWAEVALDGIVLFETGLRLSARLARIRRDIADGRIVRRSAHGHPYWVKQEVA